MAQSLLPPSSGSSAPFSDFLDELLDGLEEDARESQTAQPGRKAGIALDAALKYSASLECTHNSVIPGLLFRN